jgi:hypothetical protein
LERDDASLIIESRIQHGEKKVLYLPELKEQYLALEEEDIGFHNIVAGDIVNIAYWKGRPGYVPGYLEASQ